MNAHLMSSTVHALLCNFTLSQISVLFVIIESHVNDDDSNLLFRCLLNCARWSTIQTSSSKQRNEAGEKKPIL
jgi:hypothetical protein